MKYHGGKQRLGKEIALHLETFCNVINFKPIGYWEPMMGMWGVMQHIIGKFGNIRYYASDVHESLCLMWKAIVEDGWLPPKKISHAQYKKLWTSEPSALKAYAGFTCSHSGVYFISPTTIFNFESTRNAGYIKKLEELVDKCNDYKVTVKCGSYDKIRIPLKGLLIYCDPPYEGTECRYKSDTNEKIVFDHEKFWNWVRINSEENVIIISTKIFPKDFIIIAELNTPKLRSDQTACRLEYLVVHQSCILNTF